MLPTPALRKVLKHFKSVCSSKTTLPVLRHLHLRRSPEVFSISATNLDIHLTYLEAQDTPQPNTLAWFMAKGKSVSEPPLDVLLPFQDLHEIASAIDPRHTVQLTPKPDHQMELSGLGQDGTHHMRRVFPLDAEDFPLAPSLGEKPTYTARIPCMAQRMKQMVPFISKDETRYVLNGVYLDEGGTLVATNGRAMGVSRSKSYWSPWSGLKKGEVGCESRRPPDVIFPEAAARLIADLFQPDETLPVEVSHVGNNLVARIQQGPWSLTCKLIEGVYPAYRQVLPDITTTDYQVLHLNTHDHSLLEKATRSSHADHQGSLSRSTAEIPTWSYSEIKKDGVCIKAISLQSHRTPDQIRADECFRLINPKSGISIRFDPRYLHACLDAVDGPCNVRIKADNQPIVITDEKRFTGVMMPVRKEP